MRVWGVGGEKYNLRCLEQGYIFCDRIIVSSLFFLESPGQQVYINSCRLSQRKLCESVFHMESCTTSCGECVFTIVREVRVTYRDLPRTLEKQHHQRKSP